MSDLSAANLDHVAADAGGQPLTPRLRMALMFLARNHYVPNLDQPTTFNELVHVRKLCDRRAILPRLADKVLVKDYVAERLGRDWLIPTLWHGTRLPETPPWQPPFVVKPNHASQKILFVRSIGADWPRIRARANRWLRQRYGGLLDEWLYGSIEPQLLVEPFVGGGGAVPIDYKFFVFRGRVEMIQVDTDREHAHKRTLFDRSWRLLPVRLRYPRSTARLEPPPNLGRMIEAAETLGRNWDFVRVDLYHPGRPLFGELTFYPNSGLDRFSPKALDEQLGALWLAAR